MSVRSGQSIAVVFTTRTFAAGVATNADSLPTGALDVNAVLNAATVTVTNLATGIYEAQVTLPTLSVSDIVSIRIAATVSGVSDNAVIWTDTKDVFAGAIPDVAAGSTNGLTIAGTNAATSFASGSHFIGTVDTLTTYAGNTPQTGDAFARIGVAGAGLTALGDSRIGNLDVTISSRMATFTYTAPDNATIADIRAEQDADETAFISAINALNQSASRRIVITTVMQYERPDTGTTGYTVEVRTYDPDGAVINATATPTITATGSVTGDLSANLSAVSNPATGLYRATYTVASTATIEQVRMDASATLADGTYTLSAYTQVADFVAATWTTADRATLNSRASQTSVDDVRDEQDVDETAIIAVVNTRMATFALPTNFAALGITGDGKIGGVVLLDSNGDKTGYSLVTAYDPAKTAAQPSDVIAARDAILTVGSSGPWTMNTEPQNPDLSGVIAAATEFMAMTSPDGVFTAAALANGPIGDCPTIEEIVAALSGISVTILSPGGFDGRSLTLNQGEAYLDDISNSIAIQATHPAFGAAMISDGTEVYLRIKRRFSDDAAINIRGVIESVDFNTAVFSFELEASQTAALIAGDNAYRFDIEVVLQGDSSLVVTPIIDGQLNVRADI